MYVVGYPKSGNTWLCYLLAYCLNAEYDDLDAPGIHPRNEYQRRYVKGGLEHTSYQDKLGKVLKTHTLEIKNQDSTPVVYLVRDGRDVMVSYSYYKNSFTQKSISWSSYKTILRQLYRLSIEKLTAVKKDWVFSWFMRRHTLDWVNHIDTWMKKKPIAIVKYEDLKTIPEKTLEELMLKLGVQVDSEIIQQAVQIFKFENLSNRRTGEENKKSFYRKGIVGDWKNHFSSSDTAFFNKKASYILEILGYELHNNGNSC